MTETANAPMDRTCLCQPVPEHLWTTHYGAVEPSSTYEYNPNCPVHGPATTDTDAGYRERIQTAINALATYGVSEEMIREKARLSPENWNRFRNSLAGIGSLGLVHLAEALFVDSIYLLTGEDSHRIKFSPCARTAMVKACYPESEIQP